MSSMASDQQMPKNRRAKMVQQRMQYLQECCQAGRAVTVHFSYNAAKRQDKIKVIVGPAVAAQPRHDSILPHMLACLMIEMEQWSVVDKGEHIQQRQVGSCILDSQTCYWSRDHTKLKETRSSSQTSRSHDNFIKCNWNKDHRTKLQDHHEGRNHQKPLGTMASQQHVMTQLQATGATGRMRSGRAMRTRMVRMMKARRKLQRSLMQWLRLSEASSCCWGMCWKTIAPARARKRETRG